MKVIVFKSESKSVYECERVFMSVKEYINMRKRENDMYSKSKCGIGKKESVCVDTIYQLLSSTKTPLYQNDKVSDIKLIHTTLPAKVTFQRASSCLDNIWYNLHKGDWKNENILGKNSTYLRVDVKIVYFSGGHNIFYHHKIVFF